MFIKVQKVSEKTTGEKYLTEVRINSKHISFISENRQMSYDLIEGKIFDGMSPMVRFSDISLLSPNGIQKITVVGEPDLIESRIYNSKQLLRD
jgi:hypothetical protein